MSNKYFKNTYFPKNNEADLYANATNEIIQMMGVDMFYLPRTRIKDDHIFGEDVLSEFNSNVPITFYIENFSAYDGLGDIFSKFGFTPDNQITLLSEVENFKATIGEDPENGDLIYYPAGDSIFEIIHAGSKEGFYQLNHNEYAYKLQCKLFEYSHEDIDVDLSDVDIIDQEEINTTDEDDQFDDEKGDILDLTISDIFGNI